MARVELIGVNIMKALNRLKDDLFVILLLVMPVSGYARSPWCTEFLSRPSRSYISVSAEDAFIKPAISALKRQKQIADLFAARNGEHGDPSIEEHSIEVFDRWKARVERTQVPRIMPYMIALHDIGKPLAIWAGHRDEQHAYTLPIMRLELQRLNFTESEVVLAEALVSSHTLSSLLRGRIGTRVAAEKIKHEARLLGLRPLEFLRLKVDFYAADAGSYAVLRGLLFEPSDLNAQQLRSRKIEQLIEELDRP